MEEGQEKLNSGHIKAKMDKVVTKASGRIAPHCTVRNELNTLKWRDI